jgi:hypothetical protein
MHALQTMLGVIWEWQRKKENMEEVDCLTFILEKSMTANPVFPSQI